MKKAIAFLTALSLLAVSPCIASAEENTPEKSNIHLIGDVSNDGSVSVSDVVAFQKYLLSAGRISPETLTYSDINSDGVLNVFDLALLKRTVINQESIPTLFVDDRLPDTVKLSTFSDAVVSDVGNFATYFDNFTLPDSLVIVAYDSKTKQKYASGISGDITLLQLGMESVDSDNANSRVYNEYTFWLSESDSYMVYRTVGTIDGVATDKTLATHTTNSEVETNNTDFNGIVYKNYLGETEWNGLLCDMVLGEITDSDSGDTSEAVFYFTKSGHFAKANFGFSDAETMPLTLYSVREMTMPDVPDAEEVDNEAFGSSMMFAFFEFIFSAANNDTSEPLTAEQIAELNPQSIEISCSGYASIGDNVSVQDENNVEYKFNTSEDGKIFLDEYEKYDNERESFDEKRLHITFEYVEYEGKNIITKVTEYKVVDEGE